MLFDAHTHLFSHLYYSMLVKQKYGTEPSPKELSTIISGLGLELPPEDPAEHAALLIRQMDKHSISRMLLFSSLPGEQSAVAKTVRAAPSRLVGFTMVNPTQPDALEIARNDLTSLGLRGIELFPAMHRFDPSDEKLLYPFYQMAAQLGALVFCHAGLLRVKIREKLGLPSPFDMRFSNPLLLHRAAVDHPTLRFIIPHFGCGFLREAAFLGYQCSNVYVDTSSSNDWMRLLPEPVNLPQALKLCLDTFGPGRILFGTDSGTLPRGYRVDVRELLLEAFDTLNLDLHCREKILGRNLEQLLIPVV